MHDCQYDCYYHRVSREFDTKDDLRTPPTYFSRAGSADTFGGAATLLQTAVAQAGGKSADVAQSMLVTAWNLAIGGGGIIGGILLEVLGAGYLAGSLFILLIPALLVTIRAYKYGFTRAN